MNKQIFIAITILFSLHSYALPEKAEVKAVMQINNQNLDIVRRGLRNALEITNSVKSDNRQLDLKLVIFGPAVDLFKKGTDPELNEYFKKLTSSGNVEFFVDDGRLKKLRTTVKNLLPGFKEVDSGAYEVVKLEQDGYSYIKP
jgi:intracellular sulfur oxidation DsrE/DsrF family protein